MKKFIRSLVAVLAFFAAPALAQSYVEGPGAGVIIRPGGVNVLTVASSASTLLGLNSLSFSAAPSLGTGSAFHLSPLTFTDNSTAASGTAVGFCLICVTSPTVKATNTSVTTTTSATLSLSLPVGSTNETLTNVAGLYLPSTALANTTNGYGLYVNTSSAATNNYAAVFLSSGSATPVGFFGLGLAAPTSWFHVAPPAPASAATTGTNASVTITETGQAGGASATGATNNTGGNGGNDSLTAGAGGAASGAATGTNTGGNGGSWTVTGGAGATAAGATTASTAGNGGNASLTAGAGGAATGTATTNTGGTGAVAAVTGGNGGAASGGTTNNGGAGGASNLVAGNGGNGTQTGGAGGSVSITAGNAGTGGNAAGGNITVTPGTATGTGAGGAITLTSVASTVRAGLRNASTNNIIRNSASVVDCAGAGISATVAQVIGGTIFTCATAQNLTLPTAQGASGIVQGLPGTPAVGDVFYLHVAVNHATNLLTLVAGTGGTIYGIAGTTNGNRNWECRITAVTPGSETYTCY